MTVGVYPHIGQNFTLRLSLVDQSAVAIPVASTDTMQIIFENPSGATVTKTASKPSGDSSTKNRIEYAASTSDFTVEGEWSYQARVVQGSVTRLSQVKPLIVAPSL